MSVFDQVAIFPILTFYLSYLDQVLLPIAVMPFIYKNEAQKKTFKNAHVNFRNNFHVGNACYPYKAFEYNAKFVWVTRGVQGDKTYF